MVEARPDLAAFVDDLDGGQFADLWDAAQSRKCFEKYGARTIEGLLDKWSHALLCPDCGSIAPRLDGKAPNGTKRYRCRECGCRFSALAGTIFADAKLPLHKIMRIAEAICHNASLRLIELVAEVSHGTAFLWRHKVFSTTGSWQDKVMLSGRVWIDEMCFNDTDLLHDLGRKPRRGLSKDLICVAVAIVAFKNALAVVSENGKPSTRRINAALEGHIKPGSTIVHDCEKAHNSLVKKLKLVEALQGEHGRPRLPHADGAHQQSLLVDPAIRWPLLVHEVREPAELPQLVRVSVQGSSRRGEAAG